MTFVAQLLRVDSEQCCLSRTKVLGYAAEVSNQ